MAHHNNNKILLLISICVILIGKFQKYDHGLLGNLKRYGSHYPPAYDLSNIRTKVHILHGTNDGLVLEKVVQPIPIIYQFEGQLSMLKRIAKLIFQFPEHSDSNETTGQRREDRKRVSVIQSLRFRLRPTNWEGASGDHESWEAGVSEKFDWEDLNGLKQQRSHFTCNVRSSQNSATILHPRDIARYIEWTHLISQLNHRLWRQADFHWASTTQIECTRLKFTGLVRTAASNTKRFMNIRMLYTVPTI